MHISEPEVRTVESFNSDLFFRHYEPCSDTVVGIDNKTEEEKIRDHRSIKDIRNYVKNPNREQPQNRTQIHYYQRDYRGEEENPHSRSVQ